MPDDIIKDMNRRWSQFQQAMSHGTPHDAVLQQVLAAYTAPDRRYHGLPHIRHCLSEHESVRGVCPEALAVEAAIWFHDVVYDPPSPVNEEKSAEFADRALGQIGMPTTRIQLVHELILDTKHQAPPRTQAGQYMADIDLSSMGGPFDRFEADGRDIRIEYHHVDDATFNHNRALLFERLLARPSIYYTQVFRDRYEAAARQNIQRSLSHLKRA
jgi:predicted metal-dependent HD superfamily phosphohydrolase